MCRLTCYKGNPILLGDLIVKPENSLVCQSRDAGYHPGVVDKTNRRNILVNGDGFGIAFYGNDPEDGSCLFKFVSPAWSNKNLINLGQYIYSNLIFGHIRAATSGIDPFEPHSVSIENCHPFKWGRWTFMHNGGIPYFSKIKLSLLNLLSDDCFQMINGSTDSEHIFALFMSLLPDKNSYLDIDVITSTLDKTIESILQLCQRAFISEPCSLNICLSDGIHIVATRFRNGKCCPPSLYYNYGIGFLSDTGTFAEPGNELSCEIVISSAPLGKQFYCEDYDPSNENHDPDFGTWLLIPKNSMLVVIGSEMDTSKVSKIYIRPIESGPQKDNDCHDPSRVNKSRSENAIFPSQQPPPVITVETPFYNVISFDSNLSKSISLRNEGSLRYESECILKQIYPNGKCMSMKILSSSPESTTCSLEYAMNNGIRQKKNNTTCIVQERNVVTKTTTRQHSDSECYDIRTTRKVEQTINSFDKPEIKKPVERPNQLILSLMEKNAWNFFYTVILLYIVYILKYELWCGNCSMPVPM